MRLPVAVTGLVVVAAVGCFAFWPGLLTGLSNLIFSPFLAASGVDVAGEIMAPGVAYFALGAALFIVFFVGVRKLSGDR